MGCIVIVRPPRFDDIGHLPNWFQVILGGIRGVLKIISDPECSAKMAVPILTDLIGIIGTYSIPTVTYHLVNLTTEIAQRFAYSQRGFWRDKVIYETRGMIFDDSVLTCEGSNYHTYYRIINQREYGSVGLLGRTVTMIPITDRAIGVWVSGDYLYISKPDELSVYFIKENRLPEIQYQIRTPRQVIQAGTKRDHMLTHVRGHVFLQEDGQVVMIRHEYPWVKLDLVPNPEPVVGSVYGFYWKMNSLVRYFELIQLDRDGVVRDPEGASVWSGVVWISAFGAYCRGGKQISENWGRDERIQMENGIGLAGQPGPDFEGADRVHLPSCRKWYMCPDSDESTALLGVDGTFRISGEERINQLPLPPVKLANGGPSTEFGVIY